MILNALNLHRTSTLSQLTVSKFARVIDSEMWYQHVTPSKATVVR